MAKRGEQEASAPAPRIPVQAADEPILNGPYLEPTRHWIYQQGKPYVQPGRRPASYWYKDKKVGTAQQELLAEEQRDDLVLVNKLRTDVGRWREAKYRGATEVTRELFRYWFDPKRSRRMFFCQQEAIETLVYLLELALPGRLGSTQFRSFEVDKDVLGKLLTGERPGFEVRSDAVWPRLIDPPADEQLLPLRRLGCKMATGSGKTLVMAMVASWAFCNRGRGGDDRFPGAILVCAPNLTVKRRLQVLRPDYEGRHYYDEFDLLPTKYREFLGVGKILVTNWHVFAPKSPHREGDTSYAVVQKGEETLGAFAQDRLGALTERLPLIVLNDEGHHCWRPNPGFKGSDKKGLSAEEKKALEEEEAEARQWLNGLDKINNSGIAGPNAPGILAAVDLSATPFYLGNSGYPEGSPFPWLVSDFGLVDAIESGIVKIPRLPVLDDTGNLDDAGRPDPKFFRLWMHVNNAMRASDRVGKKVKPESIYREAESALKQLAAQWREKFLLDQAEIRGDRPVPPALILVCNDTDIADYVYGRISGEKIVTRTIKTGKKEKTIEETVYGDSAVLAEFSNSEAEKRTIRIDSELLQKIETEEGESKDEAATRLRKIVDTVGKRGQPGEQVRCIVSVSMLTEGWDANNVTHILGLRAFDSQLLCEQVVGRGLRRMSYDVNSDGRLEPEYVDVYGIPFSLIPFKGRPTKSGVSDKKQHHIFAMDERAAFRIEMPVVEGYTYDVRGSGVHCDVDSLEGMVVDDEPTEVYLSAPRGYEDQGGAAVIGNEFVKQTRDSYYATVRFQQILFRLAQLVTDDLIAGSTGEGVDAVRQDLRARHQIFGDVLRIVTQYVARKVKFARGVDERELGMEKYSQRVRERVRAAITKDTPESRLMPIINDYQPVVSTDDVDELTTLPVYALTKSHLNAAAVRSIGEDAPIGEQTAIDLLEALDVVEAFAPNSRKIGFQIPYEYQGEPRRYEPDFLVRLRNAGSTPTRLILIEVKGVAGEMHNPDEVKAKADAAKQWCEAVSNAARWGRWDYAICRNLSEMEAKLRGYEAPGATMGKLLPFRFVEHPKKEQRYATCVPLVSLYAAATGWSEAQASIEDVDTKVSDWVAWDRGKPFGAGMFVARVHGPSMEPGVPDGSYCLFREFPGGDPVGRKLLLWHSTISDPDTGGQYTLKVFRRRKGKVVLEPTNPAYDSFDVPDTGADGELRIVAELVEVVGR